MNGKAGRMKFGISHKGRTGGGEKGRALARTALTGALLLLSAGLARAQGIIYLQDWESGIQGWYSKAGATDPVTIVSDPTAPSPDHAQQITHKDGAGSYFSPLIPLQAGSTYCFSGWIRWAGGGWPTAGIDNYDAGGNFLGENWLIGQAGLDTGLAVGDLVTPVPSDVLEWTWYAKTFVLQAGAAGVRMKDELWFAAAKPGSDLGLFDDMAIYDGACPTEPLRPEITVQIDIKPGSFPNSINLDSSGVIPVAILSTDTFDAATVDPSTVLFGPTGTEAAPVQYALKDVDGDGDIDLILHFDTQAAGFQCGNESGTVTGLTFDGDPIVGTDSVRILHC